MKLKIFSKYFLFVYALILGGFAYLLSPPENYDLFRHFERITSLKMLSFSTIMEQSKTGYYIFDAYAWVINEFGLSIHVLPALTVFLAYSFVFLVFYNIKKTNDRQISLISLSLIFLVFILSVDFVGLSSGIRSGLATCFLFYLAYKLYFQKKFLLFIVGSAFAFFIHPFSIAISIVVICPFFFPIIVKIAKPLIFCSIIFIIGTKLTSYLLSNLEELLRLLPFYKGHYLSLSGEWGASYINTRNINGIIGDYIISRLPIYVAITYLALSRNISNRYLYICLILIAIYLGLFYSYYTIFTRMASLFTLLFSLYISQQFLTYRNSFEKNYLVTYTSTLIINLTYIFYNANGYILSFFDI